MKRQIFRKNPNSIFVPKDEIIRLIENLNKGGTVYRATKGGHLADNIILTFTHVITDTSIKNEVLPMDSNFVFQIFSNTPHHSKSSM